MVPQKIKKYKLKKKEENKGRNGLSSLYIVSSFHLLPQTQYITQTLD